MLHTTLAALSFGVNQASRGKQYALRKTLKVIKFNIKCCFMLFCSRYILCIIWLFMGIANQDASTSTPLSNFRLMSHSRLYVSPNYKAILSTHASVRMATEHIELRPRRARHCVCMPSSCATWSSLSKRSFSFRNNFQFPTPKSSETKTRKAVTLIPT